jgi:hypothetical protein
MKAHMGRSYTAVIFVIVAMLTTACYFGSNAESWLRKLLLFGTIKTELSLPHIVRLWPLVVQHMCI